MRRATSPRQPVEDRGPIGAVPFFNDDCPNGGKWMFLHPDNLPGGWNGRGVNVKARIELFTPPANQGGVDLLTAIRVFVWNLQDARRPSPPKSARQAKSPVNRALSPRERRAQSARARTPHELGKKWSNEPGSWAVVEWDLAAEDRKQWAEEDAAKARCVCWAEKIVFLSCPPQIVSATKRVCKPRDANIFRRIL